MNVDITVLKGSAQGKHIHLEERNAGDRLSAFRPAPLRAGPGEQQRPRCCGHCLHPEVLQRHWALPGPRGVPRLRPAAVPDRGSVREGERLCRVGRQQSLGDPIPAGEGDRGRRQSARLLGLVGLHGEQLSHAQRPPDRRRQAHARSVGAAARLKLTAQPARKCTLAPRVSLTSPFLAPTSAPFTLNSIKWLLPSET